MEIVCATKKSIYISVVKRLLDIIFSIILMLLLSPVFILTFLITLTFFGFPVFFKQKRVGLGCKPFTIYKFRNMNYKKDKNGVLLPPEQRTTKIGRIIRATSLDELPQLFNILKGDMSFIGPRPLLLDYLHLYSAHQLRRHEVRPGFECPQFHKIDHIRSWNEQFDNDVWYVDNCSFWIDIIMIFKLIGMVFDFKKNKNRIRGDREPFNGRN